MKKYILGIDPGLSGDIEEYQIAKILYDEMVSTGEYVGDFQVEGLTVVDGEFDLVGIALAIMRRMNTQVKL